MTVVVKKYGRWNEDCNWQLESRSVKEVPMDSLKDIADVTGFTYSARHEECYMVSENKLRLTVITRA